MFKLNPNPTFTASVEIPRPGEDAGKIDFTFKHRTRDQVKAIIEASQGGKPDIEILDDIVDGWGESVDAKFSRKALEQLLQNFHGAGLAIMRTYFKELAQGRSGN